MSLSPQLSAELNRLSGNPAALPHTALLSAPDGVDVAVEFVAVDRLGCAFEQLRIRVPALAGCDTDKLTEWAEALSRRVTYLLEGLGPIEIDTQAGQVLVRSNPPDQQPAGTSYYEVRLQSDTGGNFSLRRFQAVKGAPGRTQVDVQLTHEVLLKLVDDLVDTIPAP
ncbi:MAG: hypothetical protein WD066_19590 [Planctomycetaceae bacterium]